MPPGAGREVPSLKAIATNILRPLFHIVDDVGDAGFDLIKELLASATAAQLHRIEANSPHLMPDTEGLWKELAIKDFVEVRKAVEDDLLEEEPKSWRALHQAEAILYTERLEAASQKVKDRYKTISASRATSGKVDGVAMAKRKKFNSMLSGQSRPRKLMEQVRFNSKQIQRIHAPKRRPGIPIPTRPASSTTKSTNSPRKPPPKIHTVTRTVTSTVTRTVTRTVEVSASRSSDSSSARSTPAPSHLNRASPSPFSPAAMPSHRTVAPLPHRRLSAASPPPPSSAAAPPRPLPHALSPPPPPGAIRPSAKALNAIFLKRKR